MKTIRIVILAGNQNSDNAIDFCVLKNGGIGGVYPTQGSSVSPAGNTFDGSEYHFYNDGKLIIVR